MVPFRRSLLAAIEEPDVAAAVLGAQSAANGRHLTIGGTALYVLESTHKPVAVVPPDMTTTREPFHRLLVPLEGNELT